MKTRVLFLVAAALLPVSCQRSGPPSPSKDDLTLLVGKWSIERAESDGENWSNPYRLAKFEITAGGKYTFAIPGVAEETGTITVDPAKSPKEMDWRAERGGGIWLPRLLMDGRADNGLAKNRVQSAIYKLDGDNLTICLSMIENRRPTEFETSADSWRVLLTCKRKKLPDKQKGEIVVAPSSEEPQSLPQEVQQPWVKAGAQVGWAGTSDLTSLEFRKKPEGLVGVVPAFRFTVWNEGTVGKLPAPKVPFGLDLLGTEATDAALKELATLKSLRTLNLEFTKLTDDGLKNLSGLKSLHVLSLYATKVTDVGLKELAGLKSLHTLDLRALLDVTDVGLKELAALNSLHTLDLGGTKITDVGLKELAGLRSLQHLDLTSTRVTDAGVKELKQALPNCQIVH